MIAAVEILDWTRDKECRLLAAGLCDMPTSLTRAAAQDIRTVSISTVWLKAKVKTFGVAEIHWDRLTRFLLKGGQRKHNTGKEFREEAKLHRLAVAYGMEWVEGEN